MSNVVGNNDAAVASVAVDFRAILDFFKFRRTLRGRLIDAPAVPLFTGFDTSPSLG
jgi:hypothetical protein